MNSHPDVSIITPSYNQSEFIRDTLRSVRIQTYGRVEHIVVDGGSDDGTVEILREFDTLEWISEEDGGQANALNKGFKRCGGDIIGWLNADDTYVFRDTISKVVKKFLRTEADIVYGHALTIGPDNRLLRVHLMPEMNKKRLRRYCFLIQPSVFFRRRAIMNNLVNESREYVMDYELWLDLADDYVWQRIDEVIAADRNHPGRKVIRDDERVRAETRELRTERGIEGEQYPRLRHLMDSADLRWRRIRAIPHLHDLLSAQSDRFAFPLDRPSLVRGMKTQLFDRKNAL